MNNGLKLSLLLLVLLALLSTIVSANRNVTTKRMSRPAAAAGSLITSKASQNKNSKPSPPDVETIWKQFKTKHRKSYKSNEESSRRGLFMKTEEMIQKHNKNKSKKQPYTLVHNIFSDLDDNERNQYLGNLPNRNIQRPIRSMPRSLQLDESDGLLEDRDLPTSIDLRTATDCVGPVKSQGSCGSCWAFAAVFAVEFAQCMKTGQYVAFSEQQLVDCIGFTKGRGCGGGFAEWAYDYLISGVGPETSAAYPYNFVSTFLLGQFWPHLMCWEFLHTGSITAKVVSYTFTGGIEAMKKSLAEKKALSVCFYITRSLQQYGGGVYTDPACDNQPYSNHCTGLVGYGTDTYSGLDYWIIRNSWDATWGLGGYALIQRGVNKCGIEDYPSIHYATVA